MSVSASSYDVVGGLLALQQRPTLTLRVDLNQVGRADYLHQLTTAGISAGAHATVPTALVLDSPVRIDRLPGFAQGLVSVQDAGAQLAAQLLEESSCAPSSDGMTYAYRVLVTDGDGTEVRDVFGTCSPCV